MYAYCNNNPVNGCDPCGTCFHRRDFWNDCDKCGATTIEEKIERRIRTVAIRKLPAIFVIVHYGRNFLNDIPNNTEDLEDKSKWISSEDGGPAADCHQFTSPDRSNVKYVSLDGHHEIIVDSSGQIVTDPMDVGTYNFIPSDKNGIFGVIGHGLVDVLPWIFLGNSIDDTTTIFDRIGSLLGG
jgi:hypothetical protein